MKEYTLPEGIKCTNTDYPGIKTILEKHEYRLCENCIDFKTCKSKLSAQQCSYFKIK